MGRAVDLARVLGLSPKKLRELIVKRRALYNFRTEEINGKTRSLAVPLDEMRDAHERIKELLNRIVPRDYLFSPRKGRSTFDNAKLHENSTNIEKVDVKQFYPSTTDEHVFQFFYHRMKMAPDVAGRVTKLCTINSRVAFGSPVSPILCALVHDDIFAPVAEAVNAGGNAMSVWVDDVAISGRNVSPSLIRGLRRRVRAKRMEAHRGQRAKVRGGVVITGTHVDSRGTSPANKTHMKLRDKLEQLDGAASDAERLTLVRSLIGLTTYCITVCNEGSAERQRHRSRLAWLHNLRRELERPPAVATTAGATLTAVAGCSAPWE